MEIDKQIEKAHVCECRRISAFPYMYIRAFENYRMTPCTLSYLYAKNTFCYLTCLYIFYFSCVLYANCYWICPHIFACANLQAAILSWGQLKRMYSGTRLFTYLNGKPEMLTEVLFPTINCIKTKTLSRQDSLWNFQIKLRKPC